MVSLVNHLASDVLPDVLTPFCPLDSWDTAEPMNKIALGHSNKITLGHKVFYVLGSC
jgi:hypothetical protein